MDGQTLARLWKDSDTRDAAADGHPAGAMRLGPRTIVGTRAAVLAGLAVGTGIIPVIADVPTGHTTISCPI